MTFDGFLKVYLESKDDEEDNTISDNNLPNVATGDELFATKIESTQRFTQQPFRFTEASLVKKLEELGIGRPSTYAPIISTIQKRGYVVRGDKEGFERKYQIITLQKDKISQATKTEKVGFEKGKLLPTDIGNIVNEFLVTNFKNIMDYNFTAKVEKEFDDIATGKKEWKKMIDNFYKPFHKEIDFTMENSEKAHGERLLGKFPKTNQNMYAKLGRFGAIISRAAGSRSRRCSMRRCASSWGCRQSSLTASIRRCCRPGTLPGGPIWST